MKKYNLNQHPKKIPTPIFNVINGGAHGAGNLDFQEFHLIPSVRYPYHQALEIRPSLVRRVVEMKR